MYLSIYSASFSLFQALLPLHVVFVALGNIGNLSWLITLVVFLVLLRLFFNIFALQYARLTASLQPLEHTQWASLAPRILAWCQLTGVDFASVMVAQDLINRQAIRLAGLGRRPTLIISEALLRTSEWRQYGTFICQAIAMYKRLEPQKQLMCDVLTLSILIAWIAIAPITLMFPTSPARDVICNILFIGLGIAGMATYTLLSEQNTHATDDFVLKLTGDPLALITVHHVLAALNGEPIKPITNDATTKNNRMQRLVEKGNALWPRAPYAAPPVPSPLKVEINNYPITAPLNQATLPAPVPKVAYWRSGFINKSGRRNAMLLISIFLLASALLIQLVFAGVIGQRNIRRLRQIVASHHGQKTTLDGYFRYAAARSDTPIKPYNLIIYYIISLFVLQIISSILIAFNDILSHEGFSNLVGEYFFCSFVISSWLLIFSITIVTDSLALRVFHVNNLPGSKYKRVYIYNYLFPQALIFLPSSFIVGIMVEFLGWSGLVTDKVQIITYSALTIALLLSGDIFALQHEKRRAMLQSIESTHWAYLEPRIAAWCRLANVQFTSIQVAHDIVGRHTVRVVGMGQRPVLIISEALLRATDWRQKDALICLGIAMQQKRLARKVFLRHLWLVGIFLAWLSWLQTVQFFPFTAFRTIVSLLLLIGLPIVALIILMCYPHRAYRDLDRLAALLTGDPLALIAVQHLIAALNGFNFNRQQCFSPSAADRIEALIKLARSTSTRAPYAADLVPAILHITVNGAQVSVPLNWATPPRPSRKWLIEWDCPIFAPPRPHTLKPREGEKQLVFLLFNQQILIGHKV